ncbi:hypothetical protein L596_009428 [Steinernema carpocapsae]|uniref:Uncharacterized protein n=1 Tax=Steinernema carpocapsae TaxID=34508 RepID=A0A4U5PG42_STECR|nr:hypothetical protein L596_009428 [Steinernema carpocapsae]
MSRILLLLFCILPLFLAYSFEGSRFLKGFGVRNAQVQAFAVPQISDATIMKIWRLENVNKDKNLSFHLD